MSWPSEVNFVMKFLVQLSFLYVNHKYIVTINKVDIRSLKYFTEWIYFAYIQEPFHSCHTLGT